MYDDDDDEGGWVEAEKRRVGAGKGEMARRIGGSSIRGEREGLMAQAGHTAAINRRHGQELPARNLRNMTVS